MINHANLNKHGPRCYELTVAVLCLECCVETEKVVVHYGRVKTKDMINERQFLLLLIAKYASLSVNVLREFATVSSSLVFLVWIVPELCKELLRHLNVKKGGGGKIAIWR